VLAAAGGLREVQTLMLLPVSGRLLVLAPMERAASAGAPWDFRPFARRYRAEAAVIAASLMVSLAVYGKLHFWHGQWYFGPRFLMPLCF